MTSWIFLEEMQRKFNDAFESQNPAMFDVVFDIGGKKLYADKLRLTLASTTFESMFSDRWGYKDDVIPIKDYSFNDFKGFLSFIYSGKCNLNDNNIMAMLDMAAFYQIERLKELCEEYLLKVEYTMDNIFQFIEISDKYSLVRMKKTLQKLITKSFPTFIKIKKFLNAKKSVFKKILTMESNFALHEENKFQIIYEWAKYIAFKKQKESNMENFIMNDAIKSGMSKFLPYIKFKKMRSSFLRKFVVKKDFLFTKDELNDILEYVRCNITVKVTNLFGESIFGHLKPEYSDAVKKIKSLKNRSSDNTGSVVVFWNNMKCKMPSCPSQFKKNDDVKDHLVVFSDGNVGVVRSPFGAYTLAEMTSEKYFEFTPNCKIEIE